MSNFYHTHWETSQYLPSTTYVQLTKIGSIERNVLFAFLCYCKYFSSFFLLVKIVCFSLHQFVKKNEKKFFVTKWQVNKNINSIFPNFFFLFCLSHLVITSFNTIAHVILCRIQLNCVDGTRYKFRHRNDHELKQIKTKMKMKMKTSLPFCSRKINDIEKIFLHYFVKFIFNSFWFRFCFSLIVLYSCCFQILSIHFICFLFFLFAWCYSVTH